MRSLTVYQPGDVLYTHGGDNRSAAMTDIRCWQVQRDGTFADITAHADPADPDILTDMTQEIPAIKPGLSFKQEQP